jgi:hypothetical protein
MKMRSVVVDLFGTELESAEPLSDGDDRYQPHPGGQMSQRNGDIGEGLTVFDLKIRGYEAALQNGAHTDVNVEINGIYRRLQVKASRSEHFSNHGATGWSRQLQRTFASYKSLIDGFALVHLPKRAVFYMHIDAIADGQRTITVSNFSRGACDMSWDEMLRRFESAA